MKIYTTNKTSDWKRFALRLAAGAAAIFCTGAATVIGADLITPVAATAQSFYAPDNRAPINAINGSGMSPNNPVVAASTSGNGPGGTMWLSNGNRDTWITFDLGVTEPIAGFRLWNYNEVNGTFVGRGVKTAGVYAGTSLLASGTAYASAGPAWGTLVENMTFAVANGTAANPGVDYVFAAPVTARYLQIYVTDNFRTNDAYTGISEIRFIPANLPGTIRRFGTNVAQSSAVISPVVANAATIAWTVPFGTNLATLAPTYLLSDGATCPQPNNGTTPPTPNFSSGPVPYAVTDTATSTTNTYTVSTVIGPASTARDILTFDAKYPGSKSVITSTGPTTGTVVVVLPYGTPSVIAGTLAPTYTLSFGATADQVNGAKPTPNLSFSSPVIYKITAQDGITTKDYSVTLQRSGWKYSAWTGDADSGIGGVQTDYTVAANIGTGADAAVTVNGIAFQGHALTGTGYSLAPANADATGRATNVTGDSATLAFNFLYNGSPRTITLNNLTVGTKYETSIFAYGWDAVGRTQTFASGVDSMVADQDAFGNNNGIRITYEFTATAATQVMTITQAAGSIGTFHLSALANRIAPQPVDTDNDLLADAWETAKAGNLTDLTGLLSGPGPGAGTGDYDNDGLTDADEFSLFALYPNLDPKVADTDGDGLNDGAEIIPAAPRPATNPTLADSDGDGMSDLVENNSGNFVNAANPGTNPNSVDSDGDQYPDAYEIAQNGNPNSNTSLPAALPAGITLGIVTDEASTGIKADETYTHKISGGTAATVNGVDLDVLSDAVAPANFEWNGNAGGKFNFAYNPPGSYGTWNPTAGNVTGAGNLQMLGSFTYSAAAIGNSQHFILSALEPGRMYELRLFIRKWDNATVRPQYMKFTNGAQVTNFYILEDRPGTVLGNSNDDSAYYISYSYVAQSSTLTLEATVANVSTGNGGFHMYGLTNREASPPLPLDFTSVVRAPDGSKVTLIFSSRPSHLYAVDFSNNLVTWTELTDAVPATGSSTTYVDAVASNLGRAYYRVRDVTPP